MKITLANGTELNCIMATGGGKYVQGATRDTITMVFPATENIMLLDELFTEENCEKIIVNDVHVYNGYTIRAGLRKELVEVQKESDSSEASYEERIFVEVSQRTYLETQVKNLLVTQAEQDDALMELAELIG